ncbi:outer membrane-specific lipoprotein transporter subunit; ATP-binding component of ABC superfamily [Rhodospirillaceae bacterium LM-1]|nr:outer membrane-specific lipoprotein transporter subunit; ATP-binding component of ABC superfamily [Rhodospirillaceae bacterium LM-1]
MSEVVLKLSGIVRSFHQGRADLQVLKGAEIEVKSGEIVAMVGPSGAGKSTLLHIAGLLEKPDAGQVMLAGQDATLLNDDKRTAIRRASMGFVYQYHHLLPEFSALENVVLPQMIAGVSKAKASLRARELLGRMGLSGRETHRPGQLSGGEQQRVAICRALANRPKLLLADEPTGNLDPATADIVFAELLSLVREQGLAALIATHNPDLAARMDRRVRLKDGALVPA